MTFLRRSLISLLLATLGACRPAPPPPPARDLVSPAPPPAAPPPPAATPAAAAAATDAPAPQADPCQRGMGRLLGSLREPIDVTLYVTAGTPRLEAFARDLDQRFTGYARLAPGRLRHRVVVVRDPLEREEARIHRLQEVIFDGEGGAPSVRGYFGIVFKYLLEMDSIPVLPPDTEPSLDYWISSKIREIRVRAEEARVRIGVLSGVDEIKLGEPNLTPPSGGRPGASLKAVMEPSMPHYRYEDVDLRGGEAAIDDGLQALVITQPGRDLSDKELARIDEFLTRGGKAAAVFAGAVNIQAGDARMRATLDTRRLDKLLGGYGVELRRDAIFDWARPAEVRLQHNGSPVLLSHPAILRVERDARAAAGEQTLDAGFPAFFMMQDMPFPFASTLVPHPERQPGARLRVVARTSPRATVLAASEIEMSSRDVTRGPQGEAGQRAIAVAVEGELRSAFGGAKGRGRLLVVSSAQFLANPYARLTIPPPSAPPPAGAPGGKEAAMAQGYAKQYLAPMILTFKSTLDWMTTDEDLLACAPADGAGK